MKPFINDNFLVDNKIGEQLYHEVAKELPIIDYHNHLNAGNIAQNRTFENITDLWITEDAYKHRAMRINGIPEAKITGEATDKEKFLSWAKTLPNTIGNPLFHWSCLELKRVFGIDEILTEDNAVEIWAYCNEKLQGDDFKAYPLLTRWNPELVITSNDLLDNFDEHKKINSKDEGCRVLPSLRGDSMVSVDDRSFNKWRKELEGQTDIQVQNLESYKSAILKKLDHFENIGSYVSDHALDAGFEFYPVKEKKAAELFNKRLQEDHLTKEEVVRLKSHLLKFIGKEYGKRGWIMQLHVGALRYTSSRLRKMAGPTGGFAGIGEPCNIQALSAFLDSLESEESLPKTILYNLNSADNEAIATLTGSFTGDGVPGKVQFGPAWWYNDHLKGIKDHMAVLANYGLLSKFIGMTTDSRSLLSLSRHEYFRRVLCNTIGKWMEKGIIPNDYFLLEKTVKNISYHNIKNYLTSVSKKTPHF